MHYTTSNVDNGTPVHTAGCTANQVLCIANWRLRAEQLQQAAPMDVENELAQMREENVWLLQEVSQMSQQPVELDKTTVTREALQGEEHKRFKQEAENAKRELKRLQHEAATVKRELQQRDGQLRELGEELE